MFVSLKQQEETRKRISPRTWSAEDVLLPIQRLKMESQSVLVKTVFSQPSSKWAPNLPCEPRVCWVGCSAPLWGLTTVCPWPWDIPHKPCGVLWCCREVLSSDVLFSVPEGCPWPLCWQRWPRGHLWGCLLMHWIPGNSVEFTASFCCQKTSDWNWEMWSRSGLHQF